MNRQRSYFTTGAGLKTCSQYFFKKNKKTIDIFKATGYNELVNDKGLARKEEIKMMYSEFVAGTGCKDNQHNYEVFKNLEVMYMNTEMSKAEIYEYGKKLVDNSKSEAELKAEAQVKEEIEQHKAEIAKYKGWIEQNEELLGYWKEQMDKEMISFYRNPIKTWKQEVKYHKNQINALKWVLGL